MAETIYFILTEFLWMSLIELNKHIEWFLSTASHSIAKSREYVQEHCASSAHRITETLHPHKYYTLLFCIIAIGSAYTQSQSQHKYFTYYDYIRGACKCVFSLGYFFFLLPQQLCRHNRNNEKCTDEREGERERNRNKFPFLKILIRTEYAIGWRQRVYILVHAIGIVTGVKWNVYTRAFAT